MNPDRVDPTEQQTSRATLRLQDSKGLHCKPAATIASRLRAVPDARVDLLAGGGIANARRPIAILRLRLRCGDSVSVEANGPGTDKAVQIVREVIEEGPRSATAVLSEIFSDGSTLPHWEAWAKIVEHIDKAEVEGWKSEGGWINELMDDSAPCNEQEMAPEWGSDQQQEPHPPGPDDTFASPDF
jgi:phosphotransferase system HPr (HPr) family protein